MASNKNRIFEHYCLKCPRLLSCTATCPEVEAFAAQDHVAMREMPSSPSLLDAIELDIGHFFPDLPRRQRMNQEEKRRLRAMFRLSEMQLKVADLLFWQGKTQVESGQYLGVTQSGISRIIDAIRQKVRRAMVVKGV